MCLDRRTVLAGFGLVAGLGVIGAAVLLPESDEERIRAVLEELAAAVAFSEPIVNPVFFGSRLAEAFEEYLATQVAVEAEEADTSGTFSASELGLLVAQILARRFASLRISYADLAVVVSGTTARAEGTVIAWSRDSQGLSHGERPVRFSFLREGGDFRISRIWLGRRTS